MILQMKNKDNQGIFTCPDAPMSADLGILIWFYIFEDHQLIEIWLFLHSEKSHVFLICNWKYTIYIKRVMSIPLSPISNLFSIRLMTAVLHLSTAVFHRQ